MEPPDVLSLREPMPLVMVTTSFRSLRATFSRKASMTRSGPIVLTSRTRAHDFIIYFAHLLSGRAGDFCAIEEKVYAGITHLCGSCADAIRIGDIHCNNRKPAARPLGQAL